MTNSVAITGNKIVLRDWQLQDLDDYAHWQMPGHEWQKFDGPYYPRMKAEDIPAMIQKLRKKIEANEWDAVRHRLAIAIKPENRLIGRVNWYWVGRETNWLAIGIAVYDPDLRRQGIGYEALGLWCEYLWAAMSAIVRLDCRTWSGNVGMMRLAEKLGFKEEARFRKARIVNGRYYDGLGYGILREEWQTLYPRGFGNEQRAARTVHGLTRKEKRELTVDKRNKFEEDVFTYHETKSGKVFIYWYGKQVKLLSRKKAQKFVAKIKRATPIQQQILMAKETGNFKRGNER